MKLRQVLNITDPNKPSNQKKAYDFFVNKKGYDSKIALGIVGNLVQESGPDLDVTALGFDKTGSYGTAQWLGPRKKKLKEIRPNDFNTLEGQLEFIDWELNNTEKRAARKLKDAKTVEEATLAFSKYYERPHKDYAHNRKRVKYAQGLGKTVGEYSKEDVKTPLASYKEKDTEQVIENVPTLGVDRKTFYQLSQGRANYTQLPENEESEKKVEKTDSTSNTPAPTDQQQYKNFFKQKEEEPEYQPQPQEDLSHLYEYIDVQNFADGGKYTVKKGDSLSKIAKDQGTTVKQLLSFNDISNPNNIKVGQDINLSDEYASILDPTTVNRKQDYDYYNDPEGIMSGRTVGPTITEEQFNTQTLPEVVITTSREKEERKRRLKESERIETRYKDKFETEGIDVNSTDKTPKEIQQFLVDKGYDLDPDKKFGNNGIDGKIGTVTKDAIAKYNKENIVSPYTPFKEEEGFLGECTETQCSEYVQNEAFRNINTGESRQDWNNRLGLTGDAWKIGENIVRKGGSEIDTKNVQPGDVVTIYTGGNSSYQDQADAAGTGTTHTALVDKVNPDGSYYILHNVHKKDGKDEKGNIKYKGQEYRDLITNNRGLKTRSWLNVKHAFRPNYGNKTPDKINVREDINIKGTIKGSENFVKGLSDNDFKNKIANRENLDEDEFYSLAKATLGIMGQETNFGKNLKYKTGLKTIGAKTSKALEPYIPQSVEDTVEGFTGKNIFKENEVSLGPGAMKISSNFNPADLGLYGVDKDNIEDPKNAVKATMLKLSRDYKKMISKGHSKKDALYRAIQLYNGMTKKREENYADNYDFDYVNKVINFGSQFNTSSESKEFSTIFDELSVEDKIIEKWGYVKQQLE